VVRGKIPGRASPRGLKGYSGNARDFGLAGTVYTAHYADKASTCWGTVLYGRVLEIWWVAMLPQNPLHLHRYSGASIIPRKLVGDNRLCPWITTSDGIVTYL